MKARTTKTSLSNQEKYIQSHKRHHFQVGFYRIVIFVIFLLLWEVAANCNWIDAFFFSSPSRIIKCTVELVLNKNLFMHIGITLLETFLSFLLVCLFSLIIATALWYSGKLSEVLEPYLVILNSLPKSALAPLFIVWLGTGMTTIIVAGISVAVFGSIISFYTGFKQTGKDKITLIYTLGGNKQQAFQKVVLPGSIPILISTSKVNIGLALVGVVIGEFLAARRGLGYLIIYGSQVFQLDMVITGIIILCVIAMGFYKAVQCLEHHIKKKQTTHSV